MSEPDPRAGLTLALDAALGTGTVAVLDDGAVVATRDVVMRSKDGEHLMPAVLDALAEAGASLATLDRIVCGEGPGSFTSLRVAAAIAKGIAHGTGRPLYAVPSLALIVASADGTRDRGGTWLATIDALRGDRYLAFVTTDTAGIVTAVEPLGLAPASDVPARAAALGATPIGPDEAVAGTADARGLERCWPLLEARGSVDLASWEPVYGRLAEAQARRERGE